MKRLILSAVLGAAVMGFLVGDAVAVDRTWGGGPGPYTANWSAAANWTGNLVPGASDVAIFDGTSSANCTIDANVNVYAFLINAGYGGTITQSAAYTITIVSPFSQSAGTFVGGTGSFTVSSNTAAFNLSGGSFTAPNATIEVGRNINITGGTFIHNNGTVVLRNRDQGANSVLDANGVTFYNLTFYNFGNGGDQYVSNSCTVGNLLLNYNDSLWYSGVQPKGSAASITLNGNFVKTNCAMTFAVPLVLTNGASQDIAVFSGAMASPLIVSKPSGTVTVRGTAPISGGDVTLSGGTLIDSCASLARGVVRLTNAVTYIVTNCVSPTYTGGGCTIYSNATFRYATSGTLSLGNADGHVLLITNGTLSMVGGTLQVMELQNFGTLNLGTADFVVVAGNNFRSGGATFGNFAYNCFGNRSMTLQDDFLVTGDLLSRTGNSGWFGHWTPSGTRRIQLGGSFTQTNCVTTFGNGNLTLEMTGTNKTLTLAAGSFGANLAISNNAVVSPTRDFASSGPVTIYTNATLNVAGFNLTASAIGVNGTLRLRGTETLSPVTPTLNAGSTVRYDGAGAPVTVKNWPYKRLNLSAPGKQFNWTASTTYTVAEAFLVNGLVSSRVILRSTSPGTQWGLNVSSPASPEVYFVDVQDSNAGAGKTIMAYGSVSGGNNVNWNFLNDPGFLIQLR